MSEQPFSDSTNIHAISSNGPSLNGYEMLSDLYHVDDIDEAGELWPPVVEHSVQKLALSGVTFELSYPRKDALEFNGAWLSLRNHVARTNVKLSWEQVSRLLFYYLYRAHANWLVPNDLNANRELCEHHTGTIERISSSVVVVKYGDGEGAFESEYDRAQFAASTDLKRGDRIETAIGLWRQPHEVRGLDQYLSPDDQRRIDEEWDSRHGTVLGDVEI